MPEKIEPGKTNPVEDIQEKAAEAARPETASSYERSTRTIIFQAFLIAAISAFAMLALLARTTAYFPFDLTITRGLQTYHGSWYDSLMRLISWFGFSPQAILITAIIILLIFLFGFRWEGVMALVTALGIQAANLAIKLLIHRPRPTANLVHVLQNVGGYSFPSGHVMLYTGFFGFIWFLAFTLLKPSWFRTLILLVFGLLIALVGASRIYEGEHWASDVLGAYLLSSLLLVVTIQLYRWGKPRFFVNQPVVPPSPEEQKQAKS